MWFSASAGILINTFNPFPDGETKTDKTNLLLINISLSCNISFCFLYPSKSKHIIPLCSSKDESLRLLNCPEKQIAGKFFLSSFRAVLSFSFLISLIRFFDLPSLILLSMKETSLKKGVSVSLIFLNIVTCVSNDLSF